MTTHPRNDTHDLELLDDETRHAYCTGCHPNHQLGVPFTARCGRRAVGFRGTAHQPPANACPDCLIAVNLPCDQEHP